MIRSPWIAAALILVLAVLACTIPGVSGDDTGLVATQVALGIQQTSVAVQQMTLAAGGAEPQVSANTPSPENSIAPTEASVVSTSTPVDMQARIKASNILIYEDIVGDPSLVPIVTNTINYMNFSGGKIVNAGDGMGRFKEHALSATKWDLMIVAAELRTSFSGEMFEMMYDHINNGGAAIIEVWYLDKVASGKIAPILSKCGVSFHRDWWRNHDYDPFSYSIYWLDKFNPLLSTPNTVPAPSYPYPEWFGDAGDLLKLGSGGDAVLVGGLHLDRKSDYGVLASCMGGRMVIQTFSSHDYKYSLVQPLWENYITYTLTKHYEYTP
ncbi:MAG: hypothetical protein C4586_06010 [Anaerolineaceae bacterium]|nr:MAG: hypothetical protein C4586_06010 [Anaerolineaceae bacterium]